MPVVWRPDQLPDVDDVRPGRCDRCRRPARDGKRIVLYGHGVRCRGIVVAPRHEGGPALTECWCRRYRCTACGAVHTVLPVGVLPRFLYSVFAIAWAFALVAAPPVGHGRCDADAYDVQGMNPMRGWTKPWPYRWRSLGRWRNRLAGWWPAWSSVDALVVGLRRRAGTDEAAALLVAAARSHVRWGRAM